MFNIIQKTILWNQFKFQLPMIICAIWVISVQKKLIWNTLKKWTSWENFWNPEKIKFLQILGLGIITLIISNFLAQTFSKELIRKQKDEIVEKIKEEGLSISDVEENSQSTQENKKISNSDQNKSTKIPFYNISPVFSFITIVCLAPIIEECLFRYLIFESLGKKNSLAYIFSGASFIFFHWMGPIHGILTFTTISLLIIYYLPITIFLIYAYKKSNWNITYPIFFHFLWNSLIFFSIALKTKR